MDGYTSERILKQREDSMVELVRDADGAPHIRRTIMRDAREVYFSLKALKSSRIPKIESVELGEDTVVIEEFIDGKTLDELKLTRTFTRRDMISIAKQLLSALADLDVMSVIHRDIKASNIMLTDDGDLYLIDFDVARIYRPGADRDTSLAGTKGHAAPEQYGAGQSDARSDIYGVGIVLRELCAAAGLKKSDALHRFATSCARFDPVDRFDSAADALAALKKIKNAKIRIAAAAAALIATLACAMLIVHLAGQKSDEERLAQEQAERAKSVAENIMYWRLKPIEPGLDYIPIHWGYSDGPGKEFFQFESYPDHGLSDDYYFSCEIDGEYLHIELSNDENPESWTYVFSNDHFLKEIYERPFTNSVEVMGIDLDCNGTQELMICLRRIGKRIVGYDRHEESYLIGGMTKIIRHTHERGFEVADGFIVSPFLEFYKIHDEDFVRLNSDGPHYKYIDGVLYRNSFNYDAPKIIEEWDAIRDS